MLKLQQQYQISSDTTARKLLIKKLQDSNPYVLYAPDLLTSEMNFERTDKQQNTIHFPYENTSKCTTGLNTFKERQMLLFGLTSRSAFQYFLAKNDNGIMHFIK